MFIFNKPNYKNLRRKLRTNQTDAERKVWGILKNHQILGTRFLRQYGVGNYILDFYCPKLKLAFEIDGGQHNEPEEKDNDIARTDFLESNGITVVRFWNNEVLQNLEGVYQKIFEIIRKNGINPS